MFKEVTPFGFVFLYIYIYIYIKGFVGNCRRRRRRTCFAMNAKGSLGSPGRDVLGAHVKLARALSSNAPAPWTATPLELAVEATRRPCLPE